MWRGLIFTLCVYSLYGCGIRLCGDGRIQTEQCSTPIPIPQPIPYDEYVPEYNQASLSNELSVPEERQSTEVWCWAATIAMAVNYAYGSSIEDCEVLSTYDRSLGGWGLCCENKQACARPGSTNEMLYIMDRIYGLSGSYYPNAISYQEIVTNIDNNRPMIIGLKNPSAGIGHVIVVTGYTLPGGLTIIDPLFGKFDTSYANVLENPTLGNWYETTAINGR